MTISGHLNTGGRYNPALTAGQRPAPPMRPLARTSHTAVWTGSEMIVWGGDNGSGI